MGVNQVEIAYGSAMRVVTDLAVHGGVGEHQLAFTRIHSSRYNGQVSHFGDGGQWRHAYQWDIVGEDYGSTVVVEIFDAAGRLDSFDYAYEVDPETSEPDYDTTYLGTLPQYLPVKLTLTGTNLVVRASGGFRYHFGAEYDGMGNVFFRLLKFEDNYKNVYVVETDDQQRVTKVTEPAGRWLEITYDGNDRLTTVDASDGRSVDYGYEAWTNYHALTSVDYGGGVQATYQYYGADPLMLATMDDPKVGGSGARIQYQYEDGSGGAVSREYNPATTNDLVVIDYGIADENGYFRVVIDAGGNTNLFDQGANNRKDGLGNVTVVEGWDPANLTVTDPFGRVQDYDNTDLGAPLTHKTYDAQTNLLATESWSRDTNDLVLTHTNFAGNVTTWTRDASNRVTQITYPDSNTVSFAYNSFGQATQQVLKNGGTNTYTYATNGLLTASTDALGNTTTYGYDSLDRVSSITNALSQVISYTYRTNGQIATITYPDSTSVSYGYDFYGNKVAQTNELGKVWTWTFNGLNQMTASADPLNRTTTYEYTAGAGCCGGGSGSVPSKIIRPSGLTTAFEYDAAGRKVAVIQGWGTLDAATNRFEYDAVGRMTNRLDALTNGWVTTYDDFNRPASITDPLTNTTSWTYDIMGNKLTEVRPDGGTNSFTYNSLNRLTQTIDPAGNVTSFGYDTMGSLTNLTDAKTNVTAWTYNLLSRQTAKTYADSSQDLYYYDGVGNLVSNVNAASEIQWFSYDARNRLTNSVWSDTNTSGKAMTYNSAGRTLTLNSGSSQLSYSYSDSGQLLSETQGYTGQTNRTVSYTYNDDGQRRITTYPGGTSVTNAYTDRGQMKSITVDGPPPLVTFSYDLAGRRTAKTFENGAYATYTHDAAGQLLEMDHQTTNGTFARLDYAYNSGGNRTQRIEDWGATSTTNTYDYDPIDQVTNANYGSWSQGFNFDAMGNLLSRVATTTTNSYIANHLNQYTNIDGQLLQYDAKGNLTSGAAHLTATAMDYTYDAQNRLTDARPSSPAEGDKRMTFVYDGRNRCAKRKTYTRSSGIWNLQSEIHLYYDGWNLIEERDDSGNHLASYVNGPMIDEPIARLTTNATYYYHGDALNSTVAMTGVSGTVAERYAYEVFGLPTIMDAVGNNITNTAIGIRHLFQGREWLAEVRLNDHRNRYYSPEMQRWLNRDPIGENGGINLFAFVYNNPSIFTDPSGYIYYKEDCIQGCGQQFAQNMLYTVGAGAAVGAGTFITCLVSHLSAKQPPWMKTGPQLIAAIKGCAIAGAIGGLTTATLCFTASIIGYNNCLTTCNRLPSRPIHPGTIV